MGFLEYARSIFFDKDWLKTKLLVSSRISSPRFFSDEIGFVGILPEPVVKEGGEGERTLSLMGYGFPNDGQGKRQLANLFRAAVFHIGGHVLFSNFNDYDEWMKGKNLRLAKFTMSLIEDLKASIDVSAKYPDNLVDLAFANTLALKRLRRTDKLINPATRIMVNLLMKVNTGQMSTLLTEEKPAITNLAELVMLFREKAQQVSKGQSINLLQEKIEIADQIYGAIEDAGPITEVPSLPHTDEMGPCSVFSPSYLVDLDMTLEDEFAKCLEFLGGAFSFPKGAQETWRKMAEAEAVQICDSWEHQKDKDKRTISRYENLLLSTKFKSVEIPEQNYTEYLRVKSRCKTEAHRLIESLLVARDALDEDPRKDYGVLDLQEIIQVIASKSPRMDVFMLDEYLSKSYSWLILLDVSRSMKVVKDFAQDLMVILGEVANEILADQTSWGMYAFSDRLFIIKDLKERYNERAKSRIGGIEFDGLTYMPDALTIAAQIMKGRTENARLIMVISDGWPNGYTEMDVALSRILSTLNGANISVIGVGTRTHKMESLFKSYCTVYELRDLTKKLSNLYFETSRIAAEA